MTPIQAIARRARRAAGDPGIQALATVASAAMAAVALCAAALAVLTPEPGILVAPSQTPGPSESPKLMAQTDREVASQAADN